MNEISVIDLLKTKLALVDRDCEGEAQALINEFHGQVRYDGAQLRVPPFQEVANVWLRAIYCKEQRFNAEIAHIFEASNSFLPADRMEEAKKVIARYFEEERYLGRLERFVEGVHRKAASYGIPFDPRLYRLDLATAAFTAGVKNGSRRGLAAVSAELTLYARSDKPNSAGRFAWLSEVIELKPNFMGLGLNLNALLKKAWGARNRTRPNK